MTEKDKKIILVALEQLKAFDHVLEINGWEFTDIYHLMVKLETE